MRCYRKYLFSSVFHYVLDIQLALVCSQLENHDPFIKPLADDVDFIYLDLILSNISLISSLFIHLEKDLKFVRPSDRISAIEYQKTLRVISIRKESTCTFSSITDTQFRMCSSLTWWNNPCNERNFLKQCIYFIVLFQLCFQIKASLFGIGTSRLRSGME